MTFSVLIISPEYSVREMLARYLSSDEFTVFTANSAAMAVPLIRELSINAIIMDIELGEASGLDLLLWLNHKQSPIHPILLCDTSDSDLMRILRSQRVSVMHRNRLNLLYLRQLLSSLRENKRGVTYQFQQLNLFELMHLASHAGSTKHVYITNPQTGHEGLAFFREGRVQHAMFGEQAGEEAFHEIMRLRRGMFQEVPHADLKHYTMESNLEHLMALSALKLDQQGYMQMPTTYCTVLSQDMALADYFLEHFPDAEMEMVYSESVEEALEVLESRADLFIVDLDLSGLNFSELIEALEARNITIPVILMASALKEDILPYFFSKQVNRFFLKPSQFPELGDLVNRTFLSQQFSGELFNLSLFNVLQTFSYFNQPRLLEVCEFFSGCTGQIFMADRTVQHASFDSHVGRDALKEMLKIRYGTFRQETYWNPMDVSLAVPFSRLLLYLSRFVDDPQESGGVPRDMLLQNGRMITLQAEKISYLMATTSMAGKMPTP